ncbi:hypothetical protein AVEN_76471-1 [Araneus ventricosus]|uniref:Uncharacterized protein n=1 Tax=Araneus ventricosus TaxID=182803 RepID=A0A4Y2CF44_ARAVE|nr:hypothetical protein AVEN_76471-1 [Araneus ventricosus]
MEWNGVLMNALLKAGHSPLFHSTFLGTQDDKTFRQCDIPMKIGVDRQRYWNSNEVGYPLEWNGHKDEIRFFEPDGKSPLYWGQRWGGGKCVGVAVRLKKSERRGFFL